MSEKTKWFYTEFKNDTRAVVLLAHGLNLRPDRMDQLAIFFTSNKCDVLRISLGADPDKWVDRFHDDYDAALEHAEVLQRPLYFVGFSLGALIGIRFLLKHSDHQFKKLVLFAPATHTHFYTAIPAMLGHLAPSIGLPSMNLLNYRERKSTTLNEYKKMHELQNDIKYALKNNSINIPTLLITSPNDELVESSKLIKFAQSNPHWQCLEVSNHGSQLPRKYNHLMIDSEALGPEQWEILLKRLISHLSF
ncbi:MAG: alpha/beta hydrolase [Bacteriovorax sp.]|jgi:pimeloyl-ACP methyl ester carboxylesterase